MTDLITMADVNKVFPAIGIGLKRAYMLFEAVQSFDDVKNTFLIGSGLSEATYGAYLQSVKQLYEFTGGKHPFQHTHADIERFYDATVKRTSRNTAYLRVEGLKKFYRGVAKVCPIFSSPFDTMPEKLLKKLSRTKKSKTKGALFAGEVDRMLKHLSKGSSVRDMEDFSIVLMLLTSGLRASEMLSLRWKDIYLNENDNLYYAQFIGKGGDPAEQELYTPALDAVRRYFKKHMKRNPKPDDSLFYTIPAIGSNTVEPMAYQVLYLRIKAIGEALKKAEIIKRDITFSPHLMRRSYATNLDRVNMSMKSIQIKTRHASIKTLADHYIDSNESATPYLEKWIPQEIFA